MRSLAISLSLISALALHGAEKPASPELRFGEAVKALRNNDLSGLYKGLPKSEQDQMEQQWATQRAGMDAEAKMKFDAVMVQLQASDAVDRIMSQIQPQLAQMDLGKTSGEMMMGSAMVPFLFAKAAAQDPAMMTLATTLQQLIVDVAQWLPKSGLNDAAKARQAAEALVAGGRALGVKSADDLKLLGVAELSKRSDAALKHMKTMFGVYGIQVDAFLDSLKLASKPASDPAKQDATISFTAFGKPYQIPMKLKQGANGWEPDMGALEQLAQGMGGGAGPAQQEALAP